MIMLNFFEILLIYSEIVSFQIGTYRRDYYSATNSSNYWMHIWSIPLPSTAYLPYLPGDYNTI